MAQERYNEKDTVYMTTADQKAVRSCLDQAAQQKDWLFLKQQAEYILTLLEEGKRLRPLVDLVDCALSSEREVRTPTPPPPAPVYYANFSPLIMQFVGGCGSTKAAEEILASEPSHVFVLATAEDFEEYRDQTDVFNKYIPRAKQLLAAGLHLDDGRSLPPLPEGN